MGSRGSSPDRCALQPGRRPTCFTELPSCESQVSRLCEEIDDRVKTFLDRPIEGEWPYLWLDATYVKVRQASRVVSVAVIIAVGVNSDGRREVLGPVSSADIPPGDRAEPDGHRGV